MTDTAPPERIWLQVGDDSDGMKCTYGEALAAGAEISWCHEKIFDCDIEYVLAAPLAQRIKELEAHRHNDLEGCVLLVIQAGLSTGNAESQTELMNEVLAQYVNSRNRWQTAESKLRELGYERCTSIACNCSSYHPTPQETENQPPRAKPFAKHYCERRGETLFGVRCTDCDCNQTPQETEE